MSEIRQNMATKEWVIIASERSKRPNQFSSSKRRLTSDRPEWDSDCPFCPGNEEPELEILRVPREGDWQIRIVHNKYPALQSKGDRIRTFDGVHRRITGVGYHEVLIESPLHNTCPALETPEEVAMMMKIFQERGHTIAADDRIEHIIYFKNHGQMAGTSLVHPHTQLVALPIVPNDIRSRAEEARRYFDDTGICVHCAMLKDELSHELRIVVQGKFFVGIIPYAAFSPFHIWLIPREHRSNFLNVPDKELDDLGLVIHQLLRKLYIGLRDPDYNYVIRSAALDSREQEYLHWYVTIIPRVTRTAGFEVGSGMFINSSLPEESAAFLRAVETSK
jgi:UDPglucose--hexose-1-phosphate uridylyltransferase